MGSTLIVDHRDVHVSPQYHAWHILIHRLWIPLKPLEEETDPEKAQKLSEMIAILREVRLSRLRYGHLLMYRRNSSMPKDVCGELSDGV
jgi:hypothetical protein